jgi:hypothetical protein
MQGKSYLCKVIVVLGTPEGVLDQVHAAQLFPHLVIDLYGACTSGKPTGSLALGIRSQSEEGVEAGQPPVTGKPPVQGGIAHGLFDVL